MSLDTYQLVYQVESKTTDGRSWMALLAGITKNPAGRGKTRQEIPHSGQRRRFLGATVWTRTQGDGPNEARIQNNLVFRKDFVNRCARSMAAASKLKKPPLEENNELRDTAQAGTSTSLLKRHERIVSVREGQKLAKYPSFCVLAGRRDGYHQGQLPRKVQSDI
ncbi:hypothetical protein K402DRAFT_400655 [Aulographum hederae CBS 113979]|uniref:Uncharacterized protein n=1 Tax=Aulographum hederae CBS 113979 TaxID=1176131 RepID=A0A6G1HDU1_9PEZI|nr:hypothetical protein K402DRAFT_400655 [Aulographum hederae CBS 113979]